MSSVALSALAFAGAALAIPYHGAGHAAHHHHLHARQQGTSGSGASASAPSGGAPYPIANGTAPAYGPTGSGLVTYTSTSTDYVTVTSTLNLASSGTAVSAADLTSTCVSDVTVTTKIYETVTVTPGSSEAAPANTTSSASQQTSTIYVTSTLPNAPSASSSSLSSVEVSPVEASSTPSATLTYSGQGKGHSYSAAPSSYASSSSSSVYVAPTTTSEAASSSAPASTSSSSAAATSSSTSSSGKRGVAYNDASLTDCFSSSPHVSWGYNWGSASSGLSSALKYIPMLWGPTSDFTGYWDTNAQAALDAGADTLFSFNEPDMSTQSNLSPEDAAEGYRTYMMPYADKAKLCAPSVTNGGGEMGLTWLSNFMSACSDCQIDCVSIHWYADGSLSDYFKQQVQNATDISGGKPVYVSEFGTTGGDTDSFLQDVMPWMDSQDFVLGYSYFMVTDGILMSGTEPSTIGSTYAGYSA